MVEIVLVIGVVLPQNGSHDRAGFENVGAAGQQASLTAAIRRFRDLLSYALRSSGLDDAVVAVAEAGPGARGGGWAQLPRRSMLQSRTAAFPAAEKGATLKLRYEVLTTAGQALAARRTVAAQLASDGGVSLGMGVEGLALRASAAPEAICSVAESAPCVYSHGDFGSCGLEELPDGPGRCTQKAPAVISSPGGMFCSARPWEWGLAFARYKSAANCSETKRPSGSKLRSAAHNLIDPE